MTKEPGSKERVHGSFDTKEETAAWLRAGHAALLAGPPAPEPESFAAVPKRRVRPPVAGDFASVVWAWFTQNYESGSSEPERADDVKRMLKLHFLPFFVGRTSTLEELDQDDVLAYVNFMAGERDEPFRSASPILPVKDYTLEEIAALSGRKKSMVHRAYSRGRFPNARLETVGSRRRVLVPTTDVIGAGFPTPKGEDRPYGYSPQFVGEHLSTLRRIFDYSLARKLATSNPVPLVSILT
jgi:hypothetical protein